MRVEEVKLIDTHVHYTINHNDSSVTLEGNATIKTRFDVNGNVRRTPDIGSFVLAMQVHENYYITTYSSSVYNISEDEQLMVINFAPYKSPLTQEHMTRFEKHAKTNGQWVQLRGDFQWHIMNNTLQAHENTYRHTYFMCEFIKKTGKGSGRLWDLLRQWDSTDLNPSRCPLSFTTVVLVYPKMFLFRFNEILFRLIRDSELEA
ncbi:hypothetical protein CTI12_AA601390 [Artemisia annua]|uniref:Uncharacterized protein n=1 Tax=Artemisia annua TaxID=35608 RepID=A0A2U1KHQ5_ARTAN|nr:hypothetical protein CTI12_AA601390 [Artemisia annua]